jgi:TraG P-loop domain
MQTAPKAPSLLVGTPLNIVNTFIKLREVSGDVACVALGKGMDYRGILNVSSVNFSLMAEGEQDALIEGFKGFLNGLSFPIQILIRNLPHNLNKYLETMEAVQGEMADMAHDHAAFVRQLASKRALVKREFYIIVPADHQAAKNKTEALLNAQMQIKLRMDELLRQLERLGLTGRRLSSLEIVRLYQSCIMPTEERSMPVTDRMISGAGGPMMSTHDIPLGRDSLSANTFASAYEQGVQSTAKAKKQSTKQKQQAANKKKLPDFVRVPELIAPSSIQIFPTHMRIDGETDHTYVRTLAMVSYPRSAYPGWFDSIIQVDEPNIDFSIHIAPLPPEQVRSRLSRKAVEFRGSVMVAQRQGRTPDPTAKIALDDVEQMNEKLARGDERVFTISTFFQIRGKDRREMAERSDRIISTIRTLDFRALPAHWQHHVGFLSCLPDGNNELGRGRLFGTGSASTFYPFTGSDIGMETGVMFGVLPNGGLLILNPFNSNQLENANLVVFAKSGAGKSFFLKTVACRLLPTCNVYVIDPEAEYSNLCEQVHGQYVRLSSDSLQINPFELHKQTNSAQQDDSREEANFFREKLLNLIILFELLLSDEGTLSQKEKAFLYKCVVKTYENRGITMDPATHGRVPPNMQEFYVIMSSALRGDHRFGIGEDIYGLSERLERYLHLFPSKTRVVLDNAFINFNIRELNDTLKPIGLFLITEFLWTKMRQARQSQTMQKNSIILIDEAWLLMQFRQGAKFLEELARRIRKYGGGLWCTTQNSDDFLGSDEGKTILAMATMKFLMKQDTSTVESVTRTFHLSDGQRNFLLGARRGEGLFATKSWTQLQVVASPRESIMANTTLGATTAQAQQSAAELASDLESMKGLDASLSPKSVTNGNGKLVPHEVTGVATRVSNEHPGNGNGNR